LTKRVIILLHIVMRERHAFSQSLKPLRKILRFLLLGVVGGLCSVINGLSGTPGLDLQHSPSDVRASSLLARMSLDEKVGQMIQVDTSALQDKSDIKNYYLGSVLGGGDSDAADNSAKGWARTVEEHQAWAFRTPLKIPLLYGIGAAPGHNQVSGAVIFPDNMAMGATRNPRLVERAAEVTACEVSATGVRWTFAPCVAVAQDASGSHPDESYGSAPELVELMGPAMVRGFQGRSGMDCDSVLACARLFPGDGDATEAAGGDHLVYDEATVRQIFLPSYQAAIQSGVGSIMVSFRSGNEKNLHDRQYLLMDVLKGELGFQGIVISDRAASKQPAGDFKADIATGINAGLDMVMISAGPAETNNYRDFARLLKELVAENRVSPARVDDAVRRILRVKFQLGLFEEPFVDSRLTAGVGSSEHRAVARECVRQSLVLLKNGNGILPLSKGMNRLLVAGRAADDLGLQCGGGMMDRQGQRREVTAGGTTILRAIRTAAGPGTQVIFSADGVEAPGADAAVVVVGEMTYAQRPGNRGDLRLDADAAALIARIKGRGIPVITVVLSGRPLILGSALEASDALVAAWLPGTEGQGVADVLFGDYKPTGKLPCAWPASVGKLTAKSNSLAGGGPQFPYGFGLTYDRMESASRTQF
jgi:beta-glucosidase